MEKNNNVIIKYSKSIKDLFKLKYSYLEDDKPLTKIIMEFYETYKKQPKRERCKNCNSFLFDVSLSSNTHNDSPRLVLRDEGFSKCGIEYYLCKECGHLNGAYDDTFEFAEKVYIEESDYVDNYNRLVLGEYLQRIDAIYKPKLEFLIECFDQQSIEYSGFSFCDLGSGFGHLLASFYQKGILKITGYELSEKQVIFSNKMMKKISGNDQIFKHIKIDDIYNIGKTEKAEVIMMIGALEHLTRPLDMLDAISKNDKISYLYLSLPLFSYSVFLEMGNQSFFNRQLAAGHTHLYTMESIYHFCDRYNFEVLGEWYFGMDILDLFRFNYLSVEQVTNDNNLLSYFSDRFIPMLDDLQNVVDKNKFCSEVHLVLRKV